MAKLNDAKKKKQGIAGKVVCVIQIILSIILMMQASVIPGKYLVILIVLLFGVFALTLSLQFSKGKGKVVGIVISVITSIVIVLGIFGFHKMNYFISAIESDGLKIDNMVVAVRLDNPAETIEDAKDYEFGIQTAIDKKNTQKMLEEIEDKTGKSAKTREFKSFEEMAQTLLKDEIDAIVYNEAFTGVIEESISDYSDRIKIIHHYGIETVVEEKEEVDVEESFNLYISGIDVSGAISTTSRSDVNIIMTVNPNTKKILLTTTPRDYYVPIPEISGGKRDKLTHAGIYGVDASIRTLEELYDIEIGYYAKVNFSSLIKIVDILGGVDVNSEYSFNAGGYSYQKGMNHLNGEQALAFSRERYSFSAGDNQRGKNQEAVIEAIINKAMSPAILKDASRIIESVSDSVQTDMGTAQMKKLINMQLSDNAKWDIESQATTGHGDQNTCYSSGSQMLYVMNPDMESVNASAAKIKEVMSGTTNQDNE